MEEATDFGGKFFDINAIAAAILDGGAQSEYGKRMRHSPDWLEEHADGTLDPGRLLALLHRFGEIGNFTEILRQFIECAAPSTISDEVFDALIAFPRRQRETWIVSLAHKQLSAEQLWALCRTNVTFECYFTLAIMQYSRSDFDYDAFKRTLTAFSESPFAPQLPELLSELAASPASSHEKQALLQEGSYYE